MTSLQQFLNVGLLKLNINVHSIDKIINTITFYCLEMPVLIFYNVKD